jgi:hypothetical protein
MRACRENHPSSTHYREFSNNKQELAIVTGNSRKARMVAVHEEEVRIVDGQ